MQRRLSDRFGHLGGATIDRLERLGLRGPALLTLLGFATGIVAGFGVLTFYRGIDVSARLISTVIAWLPLPHLVVPAIAVAIGLVTSWALSHYGTNDSPGENIPEVMEVAKSRLGVLHLQPVSIKTLAAAVTLGSGGSVGAEGPVAVLGAALGSRVGRLLRLSPERLHLLLACGTAAGLSAAFGAPIAGAIFALEKLFGGFETSALTPVVVASVTGAAITRVGLGDDQVIRIPVQYSNPGGWALLFYGLVAVGAGVAGWLYNRTTWKVGDWSARWPRWVRVTLFALAVATLAHAFDGSLWGRGHSTLDLGQVRTVGAEVLLALCLAKILATALTLAGGGVGGVFTPTLVVGGAFGAAAGTALALVLPSLHLEPVPFALVGMAAAVAAATHAPLTAFFMVLEMSGDYGLVAPLLIAGPIGYAVAKELYPESIYTEWTKRRAGGR
ncbi:MAG TPA: chloride channel protein [Gemmatimonadales bacterium]|nr:chloride channel protein [Gemmatimonadales bacterium]